MLLPKIFPVTCHTDHVGPGSTFIAIKGFADDGTKYIAQALLQGASTIVIQQDQADRSVQALCKEHNATLACVTNARQELALRASTALGNPAKKLKIIGITGTKGKTTTTYLTEYILRFAGYKTALLSSIVNRIGDQAQASSNTTPESDYLQMFLAECAAQNIEYVVMEVSSHALSLSRVYGIEFDAVGFTNLTPDHMDFHVSMDDYFTAKATILNMLKPGGAAIINTDDLWGQKACNAAANTTNIVSFGKHRYPSLQHHMMESELLACPALFGDFNAYNVTMASLLCQAQNIDRKTIEQALSNFPGVPGRLQRHTLGNGARAFVDYAHNASSTHEVLTTLRAHTDHLIVVFGCGGNRDKGRRPGMGKVAAELGDVVIITSDNPRMEDPAGIINDILAGIAQESISKVTCQPDRHKAIALAAEQATKDSIIALLGKGHENYFYVQGQKLHFDDFEEISKF